MVKAHSRQITSTVGQRKRMHETPSNVPFNRMAIWMSLPKGPPTLYCVMSRGSNLVESNLGSLLSNGTKDQGEQLSQLRLPKERFIEYERFD